MPKNMLLLAAFVSSIWANHAVAADPLQRKTASLQCHDRKVQLQGDCFPFMGDKLACTRLSIAFSEHPGNKKLNSRKFTPAPLEEGDDYPVVEERFGNLVCVETKEKEKFIVARMNNGGNCGKCEWFDVYTMDGVLVGNNRDRKKKNKLVGEAVDAVYDKKVKRVIKENELDDFYFQKANP